MKDLISEFERLFWSLVEKNRNDNIEIGKITEADNIDHSLYEISVLIDSIKEDYDDFLKTTKT